MIDDMQAKLWEDATAEEVRKAFRQSLLSIAGTTKTAKGQVVIPTTVLTAATEDVINAMHQLSEALDAR